MINYEFTKKQMIKMNNMIIRNRFWWVFIILLGVFLFSLYTLIIGLTVDNEALDYCYKGFGVLGGLGIITFILWILQRNSFVKALKFNVKGNVEYHLEYTDEKVTLYGVNSGNVINYLFSDVKRFYQRKDYFVLYMRYNIVVPILKNDDTKPLLDYLQTKFIKPKK